MKKLLCVLMLGLMFGQALIETREYELIIPGDELYWAEFNHNDIERESVGHLKQRDNVVRLDKKKK